ncbi:NusB antitermination factor [Magnetococcus marinus MC-1]|uniref:Transcription antitermination protein NusB n=1 Tax=Magnetococcus marinus (strain ATCC BAA-1437 / JCM 17883 / MC-1) TaxID=156889 RepID=A0L3Z8_MAGMM|nr:transcription antitermination factor NusB [Magnetococcus marinus]ABK42691.1 NusB antitermination factor [Magnetococcus marinus MC-1]
MAHKSDKSGKSRNTMRRGGRSKSREIALQVLYGCEIAHDPVGPALRNMLEDPHSEGMDQDYFSQLTLGVEAEREVLDSWIGRAGAAWSMDRFSVVDHNILRLGIYELLKQPEVPHRVILNEAIELSKRFGGEESSRFVNGVMDKVANLVREEDAAPMRVWDTQES